jgi:hypothetical protein
MARQVGVAAARISASGIVRGIDVFGRMEGAPGDIILR